ncbi:TBC domain-containing protein kinase-like protein isoform X2 [Actinia tenebrosa]|uniref:TBC domain-containing protein kinase-like protein n=1 Tax=Actinia tenebrosa TaxID=6105 RepID=A0A6P8HIC1_ACTTE|nr:TBC domain-containing protein kinase-like protein isoform X2 [Actinia tenebrosa]
MSCLGEAKIGIWTFIPSPHPTDKCGTNGLPLTPNSIVVMGRFQILKSLYHENICQYLDIVRAKHERLIIAEEHYEDSLHKSIKDGKKFSNDEMTRIMFEALQGLAFLNNHGIVSRNISLQNILLDPKGKVKLSKFGLNHMTDSGSLVSFPIGSPKYLAPEVVSSGPGLSPVFGPSSPKVDVWSLGMVLFNLIMGGKLWPDTDECSEVEKIFAKVVSLVKRQKESFEDCLNILINDHKSPEKLQDLPTELVSFLNACLTVNPSERPSSLELLNHELFSNFDKSKISLENGVHPFPAINRSVDIELSDLRKEAQENGQEDEDHLAKRPLSEVYYLWCLAGGDIEGELKKQGLIKTKPPILSLPKVFLYTGEEMGAEKDKILLLDETTITLSLSQLRERLEHVGVCSYYPLIEENDPASRSAMLDIAELPLAIREKTVDYQFHRIVLFQRLLLGYPYTRDRLVREARTDIPPLLRGKIWAGLLGVQGDTRGKYDSIDKESPSSADRQIEVDIPRCHQYDPLLSSPTAHEKFKRVLKAWVVSHPNLGYWQGLDSLCAPFLSLHFNDEALAYACLSAFIPKYLHDFFLKDNAPIIQEYLAVFSQLIAFHDPELFNHMQEIGFIPELYAIPWFLTMFCHVFPLHKIYHLWDTLLLGNASFPSCIGVAILQQLRDQLLSFGFNECILLFSDMPEVDIDRVVRDSKKIFSWTPRTASLRRHEHAVATSKGKPEKEFLPLKQLKAEVCCRITAQNLIRIMELGNNVQSWTTGSPKKKAKPRGIVVDVRSPEEFHRGQVAGSVNIPFNQAFLEDGALAQSNASATLANFKGKIVIVMGNKTNYPAKIGAGLVKLGYPRVCVLEDQGIGVLRSQALLTVQTS